MLAKTIWKGEHSRKVNFFLWKIAHKAISTSKNLQKKKNVLPGSISKLMSIMHERIRITEPLIYAMHV